MNRWELPEQELGARKMKACKKVITIGVVVKEASLIPHSGLLPNVQKKGFVIAQLWEIEGVERQSLC